MESQKLAGKELLWGLLACQNEMVSCEALAACVEAWLGSDATAEKPALRERLNLNSDQAARIELSTRNFLLGRDSGQDRAALVFALGEILDDLLARVRDLDLRSSLQAAARAVGIETSPPASLTHGIQPGDLTRLIAAGAKVDRAETVDFEGGASVDLESTDTVNPDDHQPSLGSTVSEPGADAETVEATASRTTPDDSTQGFWPPPPSEGRHARDGSSEHGQAAPRARYRVLRPHAEGGLGAVFVAYDEELHREVALKEILERHSHITENRLRFLLEAEVTGGLEHPGIVPVHGLGQYDDGRPYYAMRFIRGVSLKAAVAAFHAADGPTRDPSERALSLRRLLTHFIDICDAIAYAHSRGVLHRDLKPANVMLGKFGETLVVDWGLAKPLLRSFPQEDDSAAPAPRTVLDAAEEKTLSISDGEPGARPGFGRAAGSENTRPERPLIPPSLGKSSRTLAGTRVGTPAFMSPEQAAGEVNSLGPASDIYSLGATLYNIVTGKLPFTGSDLSKTLSRVVEGDFPRPRTVNPLVPRPLEAIILKAMALEPEDRYASPKALRDDLEHWMADEAVSACRDPLPARLARWARRHKTLVVTSAALLLAAVAGLTLGSILLERERARTDRERILAVKNYGYAYEAAETMLSRVGDVDLADVPQMEPVRLELLKTAELQFQKLLDQRSDDPELLLLEGRTRARLGDVLEMTGQFADAERKYREAIASLRDLERKLPGDDRPLLARARAEHGLGVLLRKLNRFPEAENELRDAVKLRESLVAKSPDDPALRRAQSDSRYHLGALLARLAYFKAEDRSLYDQAIKDQESLVSAAPNDPENRIKLARYLNNLAILEARSDRSKAEQSLRKALDLLTSLEPARAALPDARWQEARALNNLATLKVRKEEIKHVLIRARDILDRLTVEFPRIIQYRRELASVFHNLGKLGLNAGKNAQAAEAFRRGGDHLALLTEKHPQVPDFRQHRDIALFQLGLLKAQTDLAQGEQELTPLLEDQEKLIAAHPSVPDYRNALGRNLLEYAKLLQDKDHVPKASLLIDRAVRQFEEALKADPGNRAYMKNLSEALTIHILISLKEKKTEQAAALADKLIELPVADLTSHLTAAMALAKCQVLSADAADDSPADRERRTEAYGRRAVEILRKAFHQGILNTADPLKYEEFLPLRTRPDFIELYKELIQRQAPLTG